MEKRQQEGNDFGEVFDQVTYVQRQVLLVKLEVEEPHIVFNPSFQECWELIHRAFMEIIKSAEKLPRVENKLFPEVNNLYLRTVRSDELLVTDLINEAKDIFHKNTVGPNKYLNVYEKYSSLLDNKAKQDITALVKEKHSLEGFAKEIEGINHLRKEIASLFITVPLSMFCLFAGKLNDDLCDCAEKLKDPILTFGMEKNRELNKSICQRYEEIAETISGTPGTTEELVSLNEYLKNISEVTLDGLKVEINMSVKSHSFLQDYAILPTEDLTLNAKVSLWPKKILNVVEVSKAHLAKRREHAEDQLQMRLLEFNQMLGGVNKEVDAFKKEERMSVKAIKHNVKKLNKLTATLDAAVTELEDINKKQSLLKKVQSHFPMLQNLVANKQPYDKLWTTALDFQNKSEVWMNGPFLQLDAEKVSVELDTMWSTMHTLTTSFSSLPGPCRVANSFKTKVDQFKRHLPFLTIICNLGIKDRHWERISSIVGFDVKPDVDTSLLNMLDLGLPKFSDKLEEIAATVSKELDP